MTKTSNITKASITKRMNSVKRTNHPKSKNATKVPNLHFDLIDVCHNDENAEIPNTTRMLKRNLKKDPMSSRNNPISSRPESSRTSLSYQNPVIKNGPISADDAIKKYSMQLNVYELAEINTFKDIYFIGRSEAKIKPNKTGASNYGYDDKLHHYKVRIGDQIAYRFEIRSVIGKGAFGQVLHCIDHKTGEFIALKMIVNTPVMNEQGQIEASVLQYLQGCEDYENSCVMEGLDFFVFRNHICITSQVLGSNLYDMCRKMKFKPLSIIQVRSISKDILKGLEFIHKNNVVHCDIKPENILLCPGTTKKVKIIDFGSSCMIGEEKFEYIQSRFYRAPEVILGLRYGPPMDIWSFACIVCELLIGHPLFGGIDEPEQMELYMEALGMPPTDMIERSPRKNYFFDENYKTISHSSSRKRRRVGSSSIASLTKILNPDLLDLLSKCFEWDQEHRITASEALQHPFFQNKHNSNEKNATEAVETTKVKKSPKKKPSNPKSNVPLKIKARWR